MKVSILNVCFSDHSLTTEKKINHCNEKRVTVRNSIMDWGITWKEYLMDLGASLERLPLKCRVSHSMIWHSCFRSPGFGTYGVIRH